MKSLSVFLIACLFCSFCVAGDLSPIQNATTQKTVAGPTQKDVLIPTAGDPTQKNVPIPAATQKTPTVPMNTPTQKTTTYGSPVQKGYVATDINIPIPRDLLEKLERLQRQPCQPVRNLGRGIIRCIIKKKIGQLVEDRNPLPLPPGGPGF